MATRNTGGSEGTRASASPPALQQGEARTKGEQVARDAVQQAKSRVERGKHEAAVTLGSVASRLRESGSQLRGDDRQDLAGEYVERAAEQIERAANYLRSADLREMVDEVEGFARRRPAVFIGSAFALGVLAARYFSSSRGQRLADQLELGQQRFVDREIPSPVTQEPGRTQAPPANPWRETL